MYLEKDDIEVMNTTVCLIKSTSSCIKKKKPNKLLFESAENCLNYKQDNIKEK